MCLNELNEGDKNVISIIQNNSKYLFNVKDLINIIDTSLTSSNSFFVQPKKIKNPYNNVAFNKSTLYNIYFFIKFNTNCYSDLLYKFFECNFNMGTFKLTYEYMLREYIIKNHVYKSASNILLDEIIYMVEEFNELCMYANITNRIKIDEDFPKDRLIKIMQPYLYLFCKALYSYHPLDKTNFSNYFKKGLLRFSNFNPKFGKKECKLVYKSDINFVQTIVCEKYFNEKHIPFNNIEKQNAIFLTDHLEYENIRTYASTSLASLFFAVRQYETLLAAEARIASDAERLSILTDPVKLKEYVMTFFTKSRSLFPEQSIKVMSAKLKPQYSRYIELYGFPNGGAFDPDKLAAINLELGIL
jgi:hypothetical protein